MKKIMFFELRFCGYCRRAHKILKELLEQNPDYQKLEIEYIEESRERERARQYDYYYVPTFYVGEEKVHEGPVDHQQLEAVLRQALES
ncbi:MAG: thioredoxin [Clostridia bacterium]|nr:thioredoxin family protein [Eubacteriales bacterium]MDD4460998.1 thioredoxin family protein [Eubacteriales bacterium]NCC48058.1 thioredoxin [Clostridia bacterium]